jgi:predicted RNA-binding protein with PUA-like domain
MLFYNVTQQPSTDSMSKKSIERCWLFKSEPDVFSIDDLARAKGQTTHWDGVRNYQARNMLRDEMQVGDRALFYHSSTAPTAIVGTAKVVRAGYPDFTAWDKNDPHFDPKSPDPTKVDPKGKPVESRWYMVDIQLVEKFAQPLTLEMLRTIPELKDMVLLRKGSRLSVQPVTPAQFAAVLKCAKKTRR